MPLAASCIHSSHLPPILVGTRDVIVTGSKQIDSQDKLGSLGPAPRSESQHVIACDIKAISIFANVAPFGHACSFYTIYYLIVALSHLANTSYHCQSTYGQCHICSLCILFPYFLSILYYYNDSLFSTTRTRRVQDKAQLLSELLSPLP